MGEFRYIGTAALEERALSAMVQATNQSANHLVAAAAAAAPVDEGTLAASIHTDGAKLAGKSVSARVQTGGEASEYAIAQHEGSAPHEIRPRNAKALHFGGIFARVVHHPGNPPTKFIERPLLENRATYLALLAAAARKVF